ncbi:MAG: hypothetical protein P8013_03810 [Candidatus Sulfobium sp.]|jgi:hypothetical protein
MKKQTVFKVLSLVAVLVMAFAVRSEAMMGTPVSGGTTDGGGYITGGMMGGFQMTNNGGFGMMNGMAGTPVVGDDGTAYLVSYTPTADPGTIPTYNSFQSSLMAFSPDGTPVTLTLNGILSRPLVEGNVLVATASLPNFQQFNVLDNTSGQSVLYAVSLPFSASSTPAAIALDGNYASVPVIKNNMVYVTTTDFGNAMMGSGTFSMFNYDFSTSAAKSYLYMYNLNDGTLNKYEIQ